LATLAALVLAGCDSTTGPDVDAGEFTVEVTGDLDSSVSGSAVHGGGEDSEGADIWVISLTGVDGTGEGISISFFRYGTRPGTGDFALEDVTETDILGSGQWGAFITAMEDGSAIFIGFSTGGTVEITSSSAERLAGTFEFDAVGFDPDLPETEIMVSASGSFDAETGVILF
jgi:hypothetical protein